MKSFAIAAALFGSALSLQWDHEFSTALLGQENVQELWQQWRLQNEKAYDTIEEEMTRFGTFKFNMKRIAAANDLYLEGKQTFTLRMNQFGDLTDAEFRDMYHSPRTGAEGIPTIKVSSSSSDESGSSSISNLEEGATVDWFAAGYTTPVKNQLSCGSCWAFSATGAMECNYAIEHNEKPPRSLSEQQLVDCSLTYGNLGCAGGMYYNAWDYAKDAGGLCLGAKYRYTGLPGICKTWLCGTKYYVPVSYEQVPENDEAALQKAVDKGCVSVAIEADQFAFTYYSGGVFDKTCGDKMDHAVLAVGYGVLNGQEYWLVKNSWDVTWGEKGFIYMCKNCGKNGDEGQCGINMLAYTVAE